jgi:hypothetical protein
MGASNNILSLRALNLISVAFAVLFVGIGVDFGIQFSVRYRAERYKEPQFGQALVQAAGKAGRPLALAAAATAAGFYSFLPTDYRGVSELGLIAGTGMFIAFFAAITVLPALLTLLQPPAEQEPVGYKFLAPVDRFMANHRYAIVAGTLAVALAGTPLLRHLHFDFNPLNLRSSKVESVATLLDLMKDPPRSVQRRRMSRPAVFPCWASLARFQRAIPWSHAASILSPAPQEQDGSWFGRWGMNYIYGTWSVLCALNAVQRDPRSADVQQAVAWLKTIQNKDGGWGERGESYALDYADYCPAPSTPSQTGGALLGLMAAGLVEDKAVTLGVRYLARTQAEDGFWKEERFTATGFPRVFFLRYHGYAKYFPLWAMARYRNLKSGNRHPVLVGM